MCGIRLRLYRKDRRWADSSSVCCAWQRTFTTESSKQAFSRIMTLSPRTPICVKSGSLSPTLATETRKKKGELRHRREKSVEFSIFTLNLVSVQVLKWTTQGRYTEATAMYSWKNNEKGNCEVRYLNHWQDKKTFLCFVSFLPLANHHSIPLSSLGGYPSPIVTGLIPVPLYRASMRALPVTRGPTCWENTDSSWASVLAELEGPVAVW